MDNVFKFRDELVDEYQVFSRSFTKIAAEDINRIVKAEYEAGRYWPQPLIQINPNYQRDCTVQELSEQGQLHPLCAEIFRIRKTNNHASDLTLFQHQVEALAKAQNNKSYVVTTGTGSGKSLSFFIPIVDAILKAKDKDSKAKTRAIVIYPMNALANSQLEELDKFLSGMNPQPLTVARYTGQESSQEREEIAKNPPDILLTNFMMLELILTRYEEIDRQVVENCHGLEFLVLDELHTYRGRQGADVAVLVRRLRQRLDSKMLCIGTSATMSSTGKQAERNKVVASVASKLFGTKIDAEDVIGETLERVTPDEKDIDAIRADLKLQISSNSFSWTSYEEFVGSPMAIWVELSLGIEIPDDEAPKRAKPKTLEEAAKKLAEDVDIDKERAKQALQDFLLQAHNYTNPQGRAPFAFKLHQFISGPGKVLTTLEAPGKREVTLDAQRFAPGRQEQNTLLYGTHFCRNCGQEYHPVWKNETSSTSFLPRDITDTTSERDEEEVFGFLCPTNRSQSFQGALDDFPEHWIDFTRSEAKLKAAYRKYAPQPFRVDPQGCDGNGEEYWFIPGKFRFCLNCGEAHDATGKDSNRLSSLSGEGRSSATTVLTLAALRQLFDLKDIPDDIPDPRKLLGFSDNRQDAALQAGHFNDFIFSLTFRSGLIAALQNHGNILTEDALPQSVFNALGFDKNNLETLSEYMQNPKAMGLARQEAQRTLRFVLGYRLLRDLRHDWRFNNPTLDQLGILRINYDSLEEFCQEKDLFDNVDNPALRQLEIENRIKLCRKLFDEMRRNLCLSTIYLDPVEQDKAKAKAFGQLNERWSFEVDEKLETSRYLITESKPEYRNVKSKSFFVSAAPRSGIIKRIKRAPLWNTSVLATEVKGWQEKDWVKLVQDLLELAKLWGFVSSEALDGGVAGYRLNSSALQWCLDEPESDNNTSNAYFKQLYLNLAQLLQEPNQQELNHPLFLFEAHEHTAQVDAERRQILEQRFRYTPKDREEWLKRPGQDAPLERLPVMFCSPTMELGVDISALNTVYLRNVPPTPANYAQRSGRAGRSGQQAIVITYCASLSPHDQWFFHNANDMVHGVVKAPTLDLTNQDLIESHLHAVWLSCAETALESSVSQLLDLNDESKPLKEELHHALTSIETTEKARSAVEGVVAQLQNELNDSHWFSDNYIQTVIDNAPVAFTRALDQWRTLYDATKTQMEMAHAISKSHVATPPERKNAARRGQDASHQFDALLKTGTSQNSDFYTYRYLASQGFLPGYNFPRLPLMAWIPSRGGRTANSNDGSMVSRPRFLALSEFGPRSLIYHQGRTYRVNRAKLNVGSADHISGGAQLATISSRICSQCGYGHLGENHSQALLTERCENCDALLTESDWVKELYRIETVETEPVERISANDEERQRQGFELQTTYRFLPRANEKIQKQKSEVSSGDVKLAELTYAPAARIWRINRGWRRRKDKNQLGFHINPMTGLWSKGDDPNAETEATPEEVISEKVRPQRIVPFVEDYRNILILAPTTGELSIETMATVQAALKRGIEMTFQIEESELVAEPLPRLDERRALLFYEAAEGGAGVLTRLATESESMAQVAHKALEIMHFKSPEDGVWQYDLLEQQEQTNKLGNSICEAGCYQCLLSYFNQPDHDNINRRNEEALRLLVGLANAHVTRRSDVGAVEAESNNSDELLQTWLHALDEQNLPLPDKLNVPVNKGVAFAAGQYRSARVLAFLTMPDENTKIELQERGWQLIDFSVEENWPEAFIALTKLL